MVFTIPLKYYENIKKNNKIILYTIKTRALTKHKIHTLLITLTKIKIAPLNYQSGLNNACADH